LKTLHDVVLPQTGNSIRSGGFSRTYLNEYDYCNYGCNGDQEAGGQGSHDSGGRRVVAKVNWTRFHINQIVFALTLHLRWFYLPFACQRSLFNPIIFTKGKFGQFLPYKLCCISVWRREREQELRVSLIWAAAAFPSAPWRVDPDSRDVLANMTGHVIIFHIW
jgi:hypothetical protein